MCVIGIQRTQPSSESSPLYVPSYHDFCINEKSGFVSKKKADELGDCRTKNG